MWYICAAGSRTCQGHLDGGGAFQRQGLVMVVVVSAVKVSLQGRPLGNLDKNLIHNVVGNIGGEHVQNKAVSSRQIKVVKSPRLHTSHQDGPGKVRYTDSGSSVDESKDGEDGNGQPPEPQDKEVLLVEQVVGEDAQIVGPVYATSSSTNSDIAGNFCREQFTHRIVGQKFSIWANMFDRPHIVQHFLTISPELVEEQGVGDYHTEEDRDEVEELAEAKVHVVAGEAGTEIKKVGCNGGGVTVLDYISEHVSLQEVSPE